LLFSSSHHHPHLHSFPTRRSSDLLRQLESFKRKDRRTISSKQLGESLNLTDAQVRKDLAYFGQFGHPGIGYRVDDLIAQVKKIRSEEHTSELQSLRHLVCRLLLEK